MESPSRILLQELRQVGDGGFLDAVEASDPTQAFRARFTFGRAARDRVTWNARAHRDPDTGLWSVGVVNAGDRRVSFDREGVPGAELDGTLRQLVGDAANWKGRR